MRPTLFWNIFTNEFLPLPKFSHGFYTCISEYTATIGHNLPWPPSSNPPPQPKCVSPLRIHTCDFPLTLTKSRLRRTKICRVIIEREACRGGGHGSAESLVCVIIRFVCSDSLLVYWWKTKSKQPFPPRDPSNFFPSFTKDILLESKGI